METAVGQGVGRSEEHTSELQSRFELVCRLLLEKKNLPPPAPAFPAPNPSGSVPSPAWLTASPPAAPGSLPSRGVSPDPYRGGSGIGTPTLPPRRAAELGAPIGVPPAGLGVFFFKVPAPPFIYTLSLHDALPI